MPRFGVVTYESGTNEQRTSIEAWLTSLRADSPASPSALPVDEKLQTTNETCGPQLGERLAWWDQNGAYWRTYEDSLDQESKSLRRLVESKPAVCSILGPYGSSGRLKVSKLIPTSDVFSGRWPTSGMIRDGVLYRLPTSVPPTSANGSGLWPTPRTQEPGRTTKGYGRGLRELVEGKSQIWPTPHGMSPDGKSNGPSGNELGRAVNQHGGTETPQTFPTPTSSMMTAADMEQARYSGSDPNRPSYQEAKISWPTPCASTREGTVSGGHPGLAGGSGNRAKLYKMLGKEEGKKLGCQSLNPEWVAWLMGFPIGWTGLRALETHRFRSWLRSHGIDYTET